VNSLAFRTVFCVVVLLASNAYAFILSTELESDYSVSSTVFLRGDSGYFVQVNVLRSDRQYISELYRLSDGHLLLKDGKAVGSDSITAVSVFREKNNLVVVERLESHYELGKGEVIGYSGRKIYFRKQTICELFDKPYLQLTDMNGDMLERMAIYYDHEFDYELPGKCFSSGTVKSFHINGESLSVFGFFDVGDGYLYLAISGRPIVLKLKLTGNDVDLIFPEDQNKSKLISLRR